MMKCKKCSLMFLNVNEKKKRKIQFLINKEENHEKINKKCERKASELLLLLKLFRLIYAIFCCCLTLRRTF